MESLTKSMNLRGRVAVVTGGSRGIGRAVVERLAEAGASVMINYMRDKEAAEQAEAAARRHEGIEARIMRGDVSQVGAADDLINATLEHFGRLDFLVCNAGIWEGAPIDEMSEELWDRVIDINLKGTWTVCRAAVPEMRRGGGGRIVIVSSTAGQRGEAQVSNYAASKGGQISFAKSLATELAPFNINVNAVAPGWVDTEMNAEVFAQEEFRHSIERAIPLGRVATGDDIAFPILFLLSDWARHITGEVININGGAVLCG